MKSTIRSLAVATLSFVLLPLASIAMAADAKLEKPPNKATLSVEATTFKGDFEAMKSRRVIRIAVPYSRTLFFNDRGIQRGITADNVQEFERWLNRKYKTGAKPITVYAIPTTRERLLPMLIAGKADIAAGNLTITPERDAKVDFSNPVADDVDEVVVTGPSSPVLSSLDDLAGKTVHVRPSSSYHESLKRLNAHFRQAGKPAMDLRLMPDALEDEDLMDMTRAGMLGIIVVDDWKAELWADILPGLKLNSALKVNEGGKIGWAFRENSPQLAAIVNEFLVFQRNTMGTAKSRLASFQKKLKALKNATAESDWQRFEQSLQYFKRYGEQYQFDYLMMTAQGFQESGLDQNVKSPVGAIGIMQVMPATGKELAVGDIHQAESNVHAGIKYMRKLLDTYFADADFDEVNRTLFAFAAYNAGPGRIARLRKEAEQEGLNPDVWFNNVELIAAKRVGQETVGYVRNIYKYYAAYKLQLETLEMRRAAQQNVQTQPAAR